MAETGRYDLGDLEDLEVKLAPPPDRWVDVSDQYTLVQLEPGVFQVVRRDG